MGTLEEGFERLHWPPLVRNVVITKESPGYRYEFFRSFTELDAYFTNELGTEWKKQEWAQYWFNQHKQTQRDDRKDINPRLRKPTGPRRDSKLLYTLACAYMTENPRTSSYKLVDYFKTIDITIAQKTAWSFIRRWKAAQHEGHDQPTT